MGTTHVTHINWDWVLKKKESSLLPSHPSTIFRVWPSPSWSKMAARAPIFISRPGLRELGRSQWLLRNSPGSWHLIPPLTSHWPVLSHTPHLAAKGVGKYSLYPGWLCAQPMCDGSITKIGRKMNIRMDKWSENFSEEVIFELNEKKETGVQILAE